MAKTNDFTQGSIYTNILRLVLPTTLAQLVHVLYNIVDRIYISYIPDHATLSLTGLGLCLPIITIIMAFANLFGMGGSPLCSIERGKQNDDKAEQIMGNAFSLLLLCGLLITIVGIVFRKPLLYALGASDATYPYASAYLSIYLAGTIFVMIGLGMNAFINAQGFAKISMMTVCLGAIVNIVLDPLFIFGLSMDVEGAALATILSQLVSALWILLFLKSDKALLKLKLKNMKLQPALCKSIVAMGMASFMASATNSLVSMVCNATLQGLGGDVYVAVMTVIMSIREVVENIVKGITSGTQPVLGYNYGAKAYKRVKQGILFMSAITMAFTLATWIVLLAFPEAIISIFNHDEALIELTIPCMHLYFFGFVMMSFQYCGQATFTGLGKAKQATFFSIFRKVIIVIPLTLILPHIANLGVMGVFMAEPISNFIGGLASYGTMMLTVWRKELSPSEV